LLFSILARTIRYDAVSLSAGTGFGREEYSPSRQVIFDPEARAVESILIKYDWQATLCRMNITRCGTTYGHSPNRLWNISFMRLSH
jgi:hypothetical protein